MTRRLEARERRLLALLILVGLVAIVWLGLVSPILDGFVDRAERRRDLVARYARDQIVASRLPALRAEAARARGATVRLGLPAAGRAQAVSALRELVSRQLDRNGAVTKGVQEVPAPAGWAGVRVDAELSLPQLTELLRQLENGRPLIVVESLTVAADNAFRSGHLDTMDVRVELAAPVAPAPVR